MLVLVNELSASCAVLLYLSFFAALPRFSGHKRIAFFLSVDRVSALLCCGLCVSNIPHGHVLVQRSLQSRAVSTSGIGGAQWARTPPSRH